MSWSSAPVLTSLLLLLLLPPLLLSGASIARPASTRSDIGCSLQSCAALDLAVLQDYVSSLNTSDADLNDTDASDSASVQLLPFGALPSDWSRLFLLQNRQPEGTPLYDNLLRLSRLMLTAYFDSEDRNNWKIQLSNDNYELNGSNVTIDNFITVSYTEFEDRQLNNVTLNPTTQRESSWFNASFNVGTDAYNDEEQPRVGNLFMSENDSTTVSYYDFLNLNISTTNFNHNFFSSFADNETNENKPDETFAASKNDDNSSRTTTLPFGDSFASSTPQFNKLEGEKKRLNSFIASEGSFASPVLSDEETSENSSVNEAIHERSKENFAVLRLRIKDNKEKNENEDEINSRSFRAVVSDKSISDHRIKNTEDSDRNHNKSAINLLVSLDHDFESKDSEELSSKSIEDFFNFEDEDNRTRVSNFSNSTDLVADEIEARYFDSWESISSQDLLTKSIEDFFALDDDLNNTVMAIEKIQNEKGQKTFEVSHETDKPIKVFLNLSDVTENFLNVNEERDGITIEIPSIREWDQAFAQSTEKSNEMNFTNWMNSKDFLTENTTSLESSSNELSLLTNFNISTSSQSSGDFYTLEVMQTDVNVQTSDNLDFDELISLGLSTESLISIINRSELNSTPEQINKDNPTTLAQQIPRNFSSAISSYIPMYLNEITTTVNFHSLISNETEDRSAKYVNIPTTISPSLFEDTTNQNKADEKAQIPASELDEDLENRTNDLSDDLFWKMFKRLQNNRRLTTVVTSTERTSSNEATNSSQAFRNILMTFRHHWNNKTKPVTKLRKIENFFWNEEEDQHQSEDETDTWEFKDGALNLSGTVPRNQQYKRSNGIAAEVKMNKRKFRKSIDTEPAVQRQYRTFFRRESRQTQFAEKKTNENTRTQGVKLAH